jgi:2-polyprenyl-3-methyl-5-hydroxy-6-metoxy-1,4-benzoquinol methylase
MSESKSKIDKMRPADMHNKALELREKCGIDFYKKNSGEFVEVPCPACGGEGEDIFLKFGYTHKLCGKCFTTWCSPRPANDLLTEYYTSSEATKFWTSLLIQTNAERKAVQYYPRVEQLVGVLKNDADFTPELAVDLGAGSGAFALVLKNIEYFQKVLAVDFDIDCCNACQKVGLETLQGSVESLEENQVSLITMNDMIEHLFSPREFLEKCYASLRNGGYISIACPNGEGFDFKIMKEKTVNITPPEHLNYFNPESLEILLNSAGFEVVLSETPGMLDVQIVKRAFESGMINLEDNSYIKYILSSENSDELESFQQFLKAYKRSSHMVVVAKKVV